MGSDRNDKRPGYIRVAPDFPEPGAPRMSQVAIEAEARNSFRRAQERREAAARRERRRRRVFIVIGALALVAAVAGVVSLFL